MNVLDKRFRLLIRPASSEPAQVVVLIGGIGQRAQALEPLVEQLDPRLEVIRFDPPGIGQTAPGPLPYAMPQLASVVVAILDQLGHDEVDLVGYSWGGVVAQQLAVQAGQRVRRLVLLATNTGAVSVPGSSQTTAMLFSPFASQLLRTDDATIGRIYGGLARERANEVRAMLEPEFEAMGSGMFQQLMAALTWTTLPATWLIRQPTLIMSGTDDPMVPAINGRILHETIRGSRLREFPGGHLDPLLNPAWFGGEISKFLTTEPPGSRGRDGRRSRLS